ncbi:NAD-dependent succinate-semialdehyde dehydrogenase [Klebsiella quasipneumoniae]|uniref:NAD-dependent succinate-semialdehyde dehydrogenase n=1 Tax=Klebsiella quasipneumoniae TaxID=1463165 RepID=UPI002D7FDF04|nr:NAD-dependent succinate-semialdehyde dehydrogenase [Klebsiella quasipneumoniae]MEB4699636.1 NAD-dependent succinate-semialdehyde dehydrogenase [Klebsiella quasipneumoniae]HBS1665558.1 NAD-dependent succinate-semialdehyde dehydrogenase [Klebsiella quasipneumoniae subsp. quasipneumoniae]
MIVTINPATGRPIAEYPLHSAVDVEKRIAGAHAAQKSWKKKSISDRSALLNNVADVLRRNKAHYAATITEEMGKPIAEAEAEIEKCAVTCEFYAGSAAKYLGDTHVASNATDSRIVYDPLGVVLAIMPWNYPFWQFIRFAAPALAAGNGALLKHANNVAACAIQLEELFREAGVPEGLVSTLLINASDVAAVLADNRVAAVTLTGSTEVGKIVASQAASLMKKQVLELGGSDPFLVLADADVELAAKMAVKARFSNTGQSCISAKRFIVDASVADKFVELFVEGVKKLKTGNPTDRDNTVGPMARANLRDALHAQVERTIQEGAKLVIGGQSVDSEGYYYLPTILDNVTPEMTAAIEETFGPVAAVIRVHSEDEAIAIANNTEFGLGAAVWTSNVENGYRVARNIEAGAVFLNGLVASDARLPFGGIKQSGYGRELGELGIREFTNVKTLWIGPAR